MAVVCKNLKEVRVYFDEAGTDIAGMSDDELLEQSEVFSLPSGRFLIVEGLEIRREYNIEKENNYQECSSSSYCYYADRL